LKQKKQKKKIIIKITKIRHFFLFESATWPSLLMDVLNKRDEDVLQLKGP